MAVITVGIRELKAGLSAYLSQIRHEAKTVIVTDRGQPIAEISPVSATLEERMRALMAEGVLSWSGRKLSPAEPVAQLQGEVTVADLLSEDRER
jgi:antitoxin (DNA-binding transcriptional repressor) of toxin-antitoxin stability system